MNRPSSVAGITLAMGVKLLETEKVVEKMLEFLSELEQITSETQNSQALGIFPEYSRENAFSNGEDTQLHSFLGN